MQVIYLIWHNTRMIVAFLFAAGIGPMINTTVVRGNHNSFK